MYRPGDLHLHEKDVQMFYYLITVQVQSYESSCKGVPVRICNIGI